MIFCFDLVNGFHSSRDGSLHRQVLPVEDVLLRTPCLRSKQCSFIWISSRGLLCDCEPEAIDSQRIVCGLSRFENPLSFYILSPLAAGRVCVLNCGTSSTLSFDFSSVSPFHLNDAFAWLAFALLVISCLELFGLVIVKAFRHGPRETVLKIPSMKDFAVLGAALLSCLTNVVFFLQLRDESPVLAVFTSVLALLVHSVWPCLILYRLMMKLVRVWQIAIMFGFLCLVWAVLLLVPSQSALFVMGLTMLVLVECGAMTQKTFFFS